METNGGDWSCSDVEAWGEWSCSNVEAWGEWSCPNAEASRPKLRVLRGGAATGPDATESAKARRPLAEPQQVGIRASGPTFEGALAIDTAHRWTPTPEETLRDQRLYEQEQHRTKGAARRATRSGSSRPFRKVIALLDAGTENAEAGGILGFKCLLVVDDRLYSPILGTPWDGPVLHGVMSDSETVRNEAGVHAHLTAWQALGEARDARRADLHALAMVMTIARYAQAAGHKVMRPSPVCVGMAAGFPAPRAGGLKSASLSVSSCSLRGRA